MWVRTDITFFDQPFQSNQQAQTMKLEVFLWSGNRRVLNKRTASIFRIQHKMKITRCSETSVNYLPTGMAQHSRYSYVLISHLLQSICVTHLMRQQRKLSRNEETGAFHGSRAVAWKFTSLWHGPLKHQTAGRRLSKNSK